MSYLFLYIRPPVVANYPCMLVTVGMSRDPSREPDPSRTFKSFYLTDSLSIFTIDLYVPPMFRLWFRASLNQFEQRIAGRYEGIYMVQNPHLLCQYRSSRNTPPGILRQDKSQSSLIITPLGPALIWLLTFASP